MKDAYQRPTKVISGGQTGIDRAALKVAYTLGIETGGWCPPGKLAEDGRIPIQFSLVETPEERSKHAPDIPRSLRTEWNVRDSDATLILWPAKTDKDPGTEWTFICCKTHQKPVLVVDPFRYQDLKKVTFWLNVCAPQILNIAGPSESSCPGIEGQGIEFLKKVWSTEK